MSDVELPDSKELLEFKEKRLTKRYNGPLVDRTEDIWQYSNSGSEVIAITTNGSVVGNGKAIIGRGVVRQAAERYGSLVVTLGDLISGGCNATQEGNIAGT